MREYTRKNIHWLAPLNDSSNLFFEIIEIPDTKLLSGFTLNETGRGAEYPLRYRLGNPSGGNFCGWLPLSGLARRSPLTCRPCSRASAGVLSPGVLWSVLLYRDVSYVPLP